MPVVGTQRYQRHDANSGKVSELRRKSDYEWERLERVTFEKLEEIKTERMEQMEQTIAAFNIDTIYSFDSCERDRYKEFAETGEMNYRWDSLERSRIQEVPERVDESRGCAKENWVANRLGARGQQVPHNLFNQEQLELEVKLAISKEKEYEKCSYRRTACKALESLIMAYNTEWTYLGDPKPRPRYLGSNEKGKCTKWVFDHHGQVVSTHALLVDPGTFWSYDLHRSKVYGERPL